MPRYSVKLKRTNDGFINEYEVDAADLTAAEAAADAMAAAGGGDFEEPEVAALGAGGLTLAQVYPVGCIYTTTVSTNPATVFGFGTWSAFGAGRVLVGLDSVQTEFDTVEETGGAKTHTLTTGEMPAHTHVITSQTATTGSATSYEHGTLDTSSAEAEATEVTGSTGGGGAHNNLQPYIVVYFWKRTA